MQEKGGHDQQLPRADIGREISFIVGSPTIYLTQKLPPFSHSRTGYVLEHRRTIIYLNRKFSTHATLGDQYQAGTDEHMLPRRQVSCTLAKYTSQRIGHKM